MLDQFLIFLKNCKIEISHLGERRAVEKFSLSSGFQNVYPHFLVIFSSLFLLNILLIILLYSLQKAFF